MRPPDIETVLKDACPDQLPAFRKFAEIGDAEAAAAIHFEACPSCDRVLEALIALREEAPVDPKRGAAVIEGNRRRILAAFAAMCLALAAALGFVGYAIVTGLMVAADETRSSLKKTETRLSFVPMPGRPDVCLAALPGAGGFAHEIVGAAPCADVRRRAAADERLARDLRSLAVIRIRGTDRCPASTSGAAYGLVMIPCSRDE